ncbi:MAG TPA: glycosyltransferase family 2 protein [Chitinophagaceae bacterium]
MITSIAEGASTPLVSVITALYNSGQYINEAIDSVLEQTYPNWEMLIVDDGSTDESAEIVAARAAADSRIRFFQLPKNHGMPFAARNLATANAAGKYIAFLDSDDMWMPEKLEKQVAFMERNDYPISFTGYNKQYEGNAGRKKFIAAKSVVTYRDLLKTNHIGCLTAMYNAEKTGKLEQHPHKYEDYIMWLQVLKKGYKAYGLNEALAVYRVHSGSISTNKLRMALINWKIYRNIMKLGVLSASWYFLHYCYYGLKKI